jgi:adenylate kinase family enzyme
LLSGVTNAHHDSSSSSTSGKSSQAQRIAQKLGLRHVSSGDLLREHKASDTPLGRFLRENW